MRIGVLSDTHIPNAGRELPSKIYDAFRDVDLILHAGDFVEADLLNKLEGLRDVRAVRGNMDHPSIIKRLPLKDIIEAEKVKIGLIHGYGPPQDLIERLRPEFVGVNAIVFGHTHSPLNEVIDGILFFNPGSPTDKIFARTNSFGILTVDKNTIKGEIIYL